MFIFLVHTTEESILAFGTEVTLCWLSQITEKIKVFQFLKSEAWVLTHTPYFFGESLGRVPGICVCIAFALIGK